ncbi:MAG TPA: DnaJ domain-containing protein [Methylocystis sp.]|nr:DnaJ domain-containing protein [Methylocystis sp.]
MPMLAGLLALVLIYLLLRGFANASPAVLAGLIRKSGALVAFGLGLLLFLRGGLVPGVALCGLGFWLLGFRGGPFARFGAGPKASGVSRVRSAMIEMELDRVTGAIRGVVLAGPEEGRALDELTREQLFALHGRCQASDPEGARLLEAYFDRRFSGWRGASQGQGDARSRDGARAQRRPATISEDEAYEILGLKKGAPASEIARAHRELMKKLHPDHGGTTDLAARVNEAKDVLMRRHHG